VSAGIELGFEELLAGADAQLELAERASDMSSEAGAILLPDGALGKLPESDEIRTVSEQRAAGAAEALDAVAECMEILASALKDTVEDFSNVEALLAEAFDRMRGES
jgi:hypothetical protein